MLGSDQPSNQESDQGRAQTTQAKGGETKTQLSPRPVPESRRARSRLALRRIERTRIASWVYVMLYYITQLSVRFSSGSGGPGRARAEAARPKRGPTESAWGSSINFSLWCKRAASTCIASWARTLTVARIGRRPPPARRAAARRDRAFDKKHARITQLVRNYIIVLNDMITIEAAAASQTAILMGAIWCHVIHIVQHNVYHTAISYTMRCWLSCHVLIIVASLRPLLMIFYGMALIYCEWCSNM